MGFAGALPFGDLGVFGDAAAEVAGVAALVAGVDAGGVGVEGTAALTTALIAGFFLCVGGGGFRWAGLLLGGRGPGGGGIGLREGVVWVC